MIARVHRIATSAAVTRAGEQVTSRQVTPLPQRGHAVTADMDFRIRRAVSEYLQWATDRELSPDTIRNRRYVLQLAESWLSTHGPQTGLLGATHQTITAWLHALATEESDSTGRPRTPATRRSYLSHLSAFYSWCLDYEWLTADPSRRVVPPKIQPRRPRQFPEASIPVALRCAPEPIKTWLALGLYLGMRIGECCRIQRDDVLDMDSPPVIIVRGKGGRERVLPLVAETLMVLAPHLRAHPSGHLFRTRRGTAYRPRYASNLVARYLRGLGIDATMHWTRHRAASRAVADGHRITVVQQILGHADLKSTMIYVHEVDAAVRELAEQLGLHLGQVLGRAPLSVVRGQQGGQP